MYMYVGTASDMTHDTCKIRMLVNGTHAYMHSSLSLRLFILFPKIRTRCPQMSCIAW